MNDVRFFKISDRNVTYELCLPDFEKDYIQKLLAEGGKPYEVDMLRDMAARLRPNDLVLDVGANVGNHTLYLAMAARAKVVAYEPNEHLVAVLGCSVERNGLCELVKTRAVGVGDATGTADFEGEIEENLGAQKLVTGCGNIPVVTLDQETLPGPIRMIKIDVEGMELAVLQGAEALLTRDCPLVYVESQDEAQFRDLSRWMIRHGYSYWDTFNVTPTHLFVPRNAVSEQDQMERLLAREVIQEYRYGLQLRRARRYQRAAEEQVDRLTKQLKGKDRVETRTPVVDPNTVFLESLGQDLKQIRSAIAETQSALTEGQRRQPTELVESMRLALVGVSDENERRGRQIRHMRAQVEQAQARVHEIEDSTAYQLGLALMLGARSPGSMLRFPLTALRLFKRGLERRRRGAPTVLGALEMPRNPAPELRRWLDSQPSAQEATSVLYADINLNIVDGSSVWLSSMASILCSRGVCILISKAPVRSEIVVSNIRNRERLLILSPDIFGDLPGFGMFDAIRLIRELDGLVSGIRRVVVRGTDAAAELLRDRQFKDRSAVYLTDFYSIEKGTRVVTDEQRHKVAGCLQHANLVMVQTPQIEGELRKSGVAFNAVELPPPIPDGLPPFVARQRMVDDSIRIGYAGKVNSRWGVIELLQWAHDARRSRISVELHIAANKISNGPDEGYENLKQLIPEMIQVVGAKHYSDLNREAAISLLSQMDFVWCWRPPRLEENTLELSTKLVEMVATGARCICYPNKINKLALGDDYPFFVKDCQEFLQLITAKELDSVSRETSSALTLKHSLSKVSEAVGVALLPDVNRNPGAPGPSTAILFAGHDLKFIDAYASWLKASGRPVLRDVWEWGGCRDEGVSRYLSEQASVVFCEWGLANAVWYSKTLPAGKRLIVRVHAQEVREKARRFGAEIDVARVDHFIFVSEEIRDRALELWGWPREKTCIVPNYLLEEEFTPEGRRSAPTLTLGMLGIVPSLKRFDRALDLLSALVGKGMDVRLKVKGHRPEELEFMMVPSRAEEMNLYFSLYRRIEADENLRGRVAFEPWGNDVAAWYKDVDVILSCSETESFHYALADGVLSGCYPVIWPWPGASRVYDPAWIVDDLESAVESVMTFVTMTEDERMHSASSKRGILLSRYGSARVFGELTSLISAPSTSPQLFASSS